MLSFTAFMAFLLSKMSLSEAINFMGYAFKDDAHSTALTLKLSQQLSDLPRLLLHLAAYAALGLIAYLLNTKRSKENAFLIIASVSVIASFLDQFVRWAFLRDELVGMGLYYVVLGVVGWFLCTKMQKGADRSFSILAMGSSLLAFLSVFLLTNLKVNAVFVHLLPGCLYAVLMAAKLYGHRENRYVRAIAYAAALSMLCVTAFSQLWLLRISNQGTYEDIRLVRQKSLYGAEKDVYLEYTEGFAANDNYELLKAVVPMGSKVLYVGIHSMIYTFNDYRVCSPTTISTPVFGQNVIDYFELNPDKYPEYVVVSQGLEDEYGIITPEFKMWLSDFAPGGPVAESEYIMIFKGDE